MNNFDVKRNLRWLVCAFLGVFHFVLLAMPYMTAYMKYSGEKMTESQSGYATLSFDITSGMDAGFLVPLFQIITLIAGIVLLLVSAYVLVKEIMGDNIRLPDSFGPLSVKVLCNLTLLAYAALNILLFISNVIVGIANSESMGSYKVGVGPGVGCYIALILSVGAVVGLRFLELKVPAFSSSAASSRRYACSACGAPARPGSVFCQNCGGQVVEIAPPPKMIYFCEACRAPAKQGVAFCSKCGGRVVCAPKPVFVCENCNTPAKEGVAFCSRCGGRIIQR